MTELPTPWFDEDEHLPEWKQSKAIHTGLNEQKRKIIEAAYITMEENVNTALGSFKLSRFVATIMQEICDRSWTLGRSSAHYVIPDTFLMKILSKHIKYIYCSLKILTLMHTFFYICPNAHWSTINDIPYLLSTALDITQATQIPIKLMIQNS